MDLEKWSKKAKIAGLVITTVSALIVSKLVDPTAGLVVMAVVSVVYLVVQGRIDERGKNG